MLDASILVAVFALFFVEFLRLERRISRIQRGQSGAALAVERMDRTIRAVLLGLYRRAATRADKQEWVELLAGFAPSFDAAIGMEEAKGNPLTAEELNRLKTYRDKLVQQGAIITAAEAEDFNQWICKLEHDEPENVDLAPLMFLGGLLLLLFAGSQGPRPTSGAVVNAPGAVRRDG